MVQEILVLKIWALGQNKYIVGLWSGQSSRIYMAMRYLMDYFNTALKRPQWS